MSEEDKLPKLNVVKEFINSIPFWVRIPVFLVGCFVVSVFWYEDRETKKTMNIITPVEARLDQRIDGVQAVHTADINGLRDVMNVMVKQNDRIMQQNDRIILKMK